MSSKSQTVHVNLGSRSYDISIGSGNLAGLGKFVIERGRATHAVAITDDNVQELHAVRAVESMVNAGIDVDMISIQPGETSKSIDLASGLWQGLLELVADRKSIVVAVGGGVVGDRKSVV
jgi:3-dehydroquinate synthetase